MKTTLLSITAMLAVLVASVACAQEQPAASPEHAVLKKDVGLWKADMKMWMGPGDPEISEGTERNKMVGDFWLISDFKGSFGGSEFTGHATLGYDPTTKKYVGAWMDSMNPYVTQMTGTYDKESKTMTTLGTGMGMDGKPMKIKNVTVYKDDGSRVMTMHSQLPGSDELMKTMEITYTKQKRVRKKKTDE